MRTSFVLGTQGICSRLHGLPKLVFRELLGVESSGKQSVQLFRGSSEPGHNALLDRSQGSLHDFLNGPIGSPTDHVPNSPLLLWCQVNCHFEPLPSEYSTVRREANALWFEPVRHRSVWPIAKLQA